MAEHFREPERRQKALLPADMMEWLPQDDIVHLIVEAVAMMGLRWTPDSGQFGGLDKLGPGCRYAASLPSTEVPAWASAGVRPPRAE